MSDALDHIAAWEAAGLIDGPTADRLRAAGDLTAGHETPGTGPTARPQRPRWPRWPRPRLRHDRPPPQCSARA